MGITRFIKFVLCMSIGVILSLGFGEESMDNKEISEDLRLGMELYAQGAYEDSLRHLQLVLTKTIYYPNARSAAMVIFRIWKKGKENPLLFKMDDAVLENSLRTLRRFEEKKEPFGTSCLSIGHDAEIWQAHLLGQYFDIKKLPKEVIRQKALIRSVYDKVIKESRPPIHLKNQLDLYREFINASLDLAESHITVSDKSGCEIALQDLEIFLKETWEKQTQLSDYPLPIHQLTLGVEVPLRMAKCYEALGGEGRRKELIEKAKKNWNSFKQNNAAPSADTVEKMKEMEMTWKVLAEQTPTRTP